MRKSKAILTAAVAAVFATATAGALVACNDGESEGVYTITFDANGGVFSSTDPVTLSTVAGHLTELPTENPTRADYTFTGWNVVADGSGATVSLLTAFEEDTTVYAQWKKNTETPPTPTPTEFDITFNANGGELVAGGITTVLKATNGKITGGLPQVTRDGYTFGGWNEKADGTGAQVTSLYNFTSAITVYAKWTQNGPIVTDPVGVFTITFNANGGTLVSGGTSTTLQTLNGVLTSALPQVGARDGYSFGGWNTKADGTGSTVTATTQFNADTPVYAKWTENVAEHTGTFQVGDGAAQELTYNGNPAGDDAVIEFCKLGLELTGGQAVSFVVDGEPLTFVADARSHGATKSGNTMVAKAAGGTYDIYVRYYEESGVWTVEMNDGVVEEKNAYYLVGSMNDWGLDSSYKLTKQTLTADERTYLTAKYAITDITLPVGTELKVRFYANVATDDEWYGALETDYVDASIATIGGAAPGADNIVINTEGAYDIYLKLGTDGGHSIYIGAAGSGDIERPAKTAKVNGTAMTDNTDNINAVENPTQTLEYQATLTLENDATVSFTIDDATIEVWIEKNTNVAITGANSRRTSFKTKKAGEFTFTLKYHTNGGADEKGGWLVYVDGPVEEGNTDPEPALVPGAYYLYGGEYGFTQASGYRQLDANNSITLYIEEGDEYKIAKCKATGAPDWTDTNFGKGQVSKGVGYLENADNMKFKFSGTYTLTIKGSNVEITSEDVEEPKDIPYSVTVTFADGVTVTVIFAMPQNWGLSATELNSGAITFGTTDVAISSSNGVTKELAINSTSVKVKVAFKQGSATKWGEATITFEDGGTYTLSISNADGSWSGDKFTMLYAKA